MNVFDKIKQLLEAELGVDPTTVQPLSEFKKLTTTKNLDEGEEPKQLDSLDKIEFVLAVEEAFGVDVSDDEMTRVITVAEMVALVEVKREALAETDDDLRQVSLRISVKDAKRVIDSMPGHDDPVCVQITKQIAALGAR